MPAVPGLSVVVLATLAVLVTAADTYVVVLALPDILAGVGYRSARMVDELRRRGVAGAVNLEGSIFEWANRGLPVVRDGVPVDVVHPYDREWGQLLDREHWPADW